jgi:hypothetical protein
MRDFSKAFLLSVFCMFTFVNYGFCGVGAIDTRYEVTNSMWAMDPYNKFVYLTSQRYDVDSKGELVSITTLSSCTAQYIAPDLILSAGHCLSAAADVYHAKNYLGEEFQIDLLESKYAGTGNPGDWALFRVASTEHYSNTYFNVKIPSETTDVINAGWGTVRILSEAELEQIRQLSVDIKNLRPSDYYATLNSRMAAKGMKPLKENPAVLKASKCKIVFENYRNLPRARAFPDIIATTCEMWTGNSGGGYVSLNGDNLYGVCAYGESGAGEFDEERNNGYLSSAKQFFNTVQKYKNSDAADLNNNSHQSLDIAPQTMSSNPLAGVTTNGVLNNLPAGSLDLPEVSNPSSQYADVEVEPRTTTTNPMTGVTTQGVLNNLPAGSLNQPVVTSNSSAQYVKLDPKKTTTNPMTGVTTNGVLNNLPAGSLDLPEVSNPSSQYADVEVEPRTTTTNPMAGVTTNSVLGGLPAGALGMLRGSISSAQNVNIDPKTAKTNPLAGLSTQDVITSLSTGGALTLPKGKESLNQGINETQTRVNNLEKWINKRIPKWTSAPKEEQLAFLNNLVEYQIETEKLEQLKQIYEKEKNNEQSLANRMLTAAAVAAAGIGGMELAQGLAEQKADKEAEADMNAYISTMRCKYGNASVKAGSEEIELPGGNDANMMKYRSEYMSLAADLKERKNALGMTPGIESEQILDKSQMGLYTQENVGITSGNYSSLYRAKMLESEADQEQIDANKQTSKKRVVGGGVAAGVGVAGGAVGNLLINGKSEKK